jgi:hypothetical protein
MNASIGDRFVFGHTLVRSAGNDCRKPETSAVMAVFGLTSMREEAATASGIRELASHPGRETLKPKAGTERAKG